MSELRDICMRYTCLQESDIECLEAVEKQLPLISALTGEDVFIDCFVGEDTAVVAAHARPPEYTSAYHGNVVGSYACAEQEPAVFQTRRSRMPVSDLKAITQENKAVLQSTAPVFGRDNEIIGVLIREKDITDSLRREEKYRHLERESMQWDPFHGADDSQVTALREANHRIKNNLQLMASILNLQIIGAESVELKNALRENLQRVLSIASIHDIISHTDGETLIGIQSLLSRLRDNLQMLISSDREICIDTSGDDFDISPDVASSVALAVTELAMNSIKHAFPDGRTGRVTVTAYKGSLRHSVVVADNGVGFDPRKAEGQTLGLSIVRATVQDKLHGELRLESSCGSRISFDFIGE